MFPAFQSVFLNDVCRALKARQKAIMYHSTLTFESGLENSFEWIELRIRSGAGPYVVFQFMEDHGLHLLIRSHKARNRGKILLAIEDLVLFGDADRIVEFLEWTIAEAHCFCDGLPHVERAESIAGKWKQLSARIRDG